MNLPLGPFKKPGDKEATLLRRDRLKTGSAAMSAAGTTGIEVRAAWRDAADLNEQRHICVELQKQIWTDLSFILVGGYWQATAYRKDLVDMLSDCFVTVYGVRRA
jgi:hypothetical protein